MRLPYRNKKVTLWVLFGIIVITMFLFKFTELRPTCLFKVESTNDGPSQMFRLEKHVTDNNNRVYAYYRGMPLIFIGGVPRSGTTLMRAMLDAHPDVRCGQETRVIPRILQLRSHWLKSEKESLRLQEAGITKEVMNSAIAQFCLEIIAQHGEPAPRLCNKDPLTLKMGSYVIELFPNAKFLFMVRDGRATVHSIISRKVTITGFDLASYRQCMEKWNHAIELMHEQCRDIGKDRCMMVYYEQLVLHPEEWMRNILKFLDVPWNEAVLHHEQFINKPNGVPLSKVERSSDQVIKPVNLEALSKWVGHIPGDVVRDMADIAPMLSVLGYDPYANPPDYGKPDAWVQDNTSKLKANRMLWESKAKQVIMMEPKSDDNNINSNNNNNNINNNNNNEDNTIENNNSHSNVNNNNMFNINKIIPEQQQQQQQQQQHHQQADQEQEQEESQLLQHRHQQQKQKPKDVITIKQLPSNYNNNNNNNGKQYVGALEDT
ncbi:protein-tyrosine sulfotransferase isoform X1 [Drosophila novamexicana]|uniref:protein-tyrosine sulfotransferase isoform X1 n=1 Tax=Drosophila novamexicana TaxID=47314 RepID=UPI0011E5DA07|nr:protein-tyrosine sulfotransferase isoform X1 [Drosophila novamexicana]